MSSARRATDPSRTPLGGDPTRRRLTDRERVVALLVADGLPDLLIARHLGIAPATVGNYVRRICLRLRLDERRALAAWVAARRGPDGGLRRGEAEVGVEGL